MGTLPPPPTLHKVSKPVGFIPLIQSPRHTAHNSLTHFLPTGCPCGEMGGKHCLSLHGVRWASCPQLCSRPDSKSAGSVRFSLRQCPSDMGCSRFLSPQSKRTECHQLLSPLLHSVSLISTEFPLQTCLQLSPRNAVLLFFFCYLAMKKNWHIFSLLHHLGSRRVSFFHILTNTCYFL